MIRTSLLLSGAAWVGMQFVGGCTIVTPGSGSGDVAEVVEKAERIASEIGGEAGFGGAHMNGYSAHAPMHMVFQTDADLADEDALVSLHLRNDADLPCEFRLRYYVHANGVEVGELVTVAPDEQVVLDVPCAEFIGLGSLEEPGAVGCILSDGEEIRNTMAVPGFLGLDYACGGAYEFEVRPDVDDLDNDGDTDELIAVSTGMDLHMNDGGPMGHSHGFGGMMGMHFRND